MTFVIEDNKPLPIKNTGPSMGELGGTLRKLQPGQSFFVSPDAKTQTAVRAATQYAQKCTGFKYSVRQDGEGLRVWRLS